MAKIAGTSDPEDQAPVDDDEGTPPPAPPATGPSADEVTVLKSRNAGLDAKVTSLTAAQAAADARAVAAEAKLAQYEQGKLGSDEALRAQLAAEQAKTAEALQEAKAARLEAKFPETFAVFGNEAAVFSDDKLAASEARLTGGADSGEPPTPRGNNPPRAGQRTPAKPPTIADVEADLRRQVASIPGFYGHDQ